MKFLFGKKNNEETDAALLLRYKLHGDSECLEEIFNRYAHLVYGVAMNILHNEDDSSDVVIQVFEKLTVDLRKYEIENFAGWLYRVTHNLCLDVIKKRNKRNEVPLLADLEIEDENSDELELQKKKLLEAISELNIDQRQCIELFYFDGRSYVEVATITGHELNAVKSYIQNGKRNLKIKLEKKDE